MFKYFKKTIEEATALSHISKITGLLCEMPVVVRQIEQISDRNIKSILDDLNASIGIQNSFEFGLFDKFRKDDDESIITLKFDKGYSSENDKIFFRPNYIRGKLHSDHIEIGLNCNIDYIDNSSLKFDSKYVEIAIELSKWMLADKLGMSKFEANTIITRNDYNPKFHFTGTNFKNKKYHYLDCPYCGKKLRIQEVFEKTEVRCGGCSNIFDVKP
jgi:hypothetical protein